MDPTEPRARGAVNLKGLLHFRQDVSKFPSLDRHALTQARLRNNCLCVPVHRIADPHHGTTARLDGFDQLGQMRGNGVRAEAGDEHNAPRSLVRIKPSNGP